MALTVTDCLLINSLLHFITGIPRESGECVTPEAALNDALMLAERAHKSLGAGIDTREMRKRWPKGNIGAVKVATLVRLLGLLQAHCEELIDSALVPGTQDECAADDRPALDEARRQWREAEDAIAALTARPARKARKKKGSK